jgi:nucleotide-binding universal stress UspA family protein
MIVLGTHGGNRLERGIIGSVAEKILRSTRWPALTVGPHVQALSSKTLPFERILFATDFTPAAASAALYAVTLAEVFGARIDVLNVIQDDAIEHPDRLSDLQSTASMAFSMALLPQQAKEFCDPRTFVEWAAHMIEFLNTSENILWTCWCSASERLHISAWR